MTKKKSRALYCPDCGGSNVFYEAGLQTGQKYRCSDCNYIGSFIIEKDLEAPGD